MPLNVEVKGQPGEARMVAEYLRRKSQAVQQATGQAQDATNASGGGWHGEAGPAFREVMGRTIPAVDGVSEDHADLCRALEDHAGELDGVKERMERALRVARDAGLQATEKQIMEPHPAPADPMPLPADKPATPEQQQQHAAGCAARADHARKVRAYQECGRIVDDARKTENNAANTLIDFIKGLVEKSPFTISSTAAGTIGAFAGNASKFREEAQKVMNSPRATVSAQLMHNTNMSPKGWGLKRSPSRTNSNAKPPLPRWRNGPTGCPEGSKTQRKLASSPRVRNTLVAKASDSGPSSPVASPMSAPQSPQPEWVGIP